MGSCYVDVAVQGRLKIAPIVFKNYAKAIIKLYSILFTTTTIYYDPQLDMTNKNNILFINIGTTVITIMTYCSSSKAG